MNRCQRLRADGRLAHLGHEALRFGGVGVVGFAVDVGLFNLLQFGGWAPFADRPVVAKVISVGFSTIVTWVGNRHWTFKRRRGHRLLHELGLFVLFSLGGLLIAVGCLSFSHYVLGFTSPLADNISANVVGLGAATIFRFVTFRSFVFGEPVLLGGKQETDRAIERRIGSGASRGALPDGMVVRRRGRPG